MQAPQPQQRLVGHADQAGVRARPADVSAVRWADDRGGLHRTAAKGGDREDLKHCGLWRSSAARPPPAHSTGDGLAFANRSDGEPQELTYVDMDTFLATF